MQEDNQSQDECLNTDEQYDNYVCDLINNILLVNLWDLCFLYAEHLAYGNSIPDCIKGIDPQQLENAQEDGYLTVPAILSPIQQWLTEQIIKSIERNEIKPKIIGRFVDGNIDSKRTYVGESYLIDWLVCRNIRLDMDPEGHIVYRSQVLDRIRDEIFYASRHLTGTIYGFYLDNLDIDSRETDYLTAENARLRRELKDLKIKKPISNTHGNAERFARNREQILGAALSVITRWPDQCQNNADKYEATKVAKLIEEKALLFWPDSGLPPLSLEKMERELSKWLNKAGK